MQRIDWGLVSRFHHLFQAAIHFHRIYFSRGPLYSKPIKTLECDNHKTSDRRVWESEVYRHCEVKYTDRTVTIISQRVQHAQLTARGHSQVLDGFAAPPITIDVVLRARGRLPPRTLTAMPPFLVESDRCHLGRPFLILAISRSSLFRRRANTVPHR